jgi:lipopolysaccharide export system permease protein
VGDLEAMTRLLDRYVLGIFVPALVLFLVTLLALFVAVDCAAKLGKFLEVKGTPVLQFVISYYLVRIPMLLVILIPSVMLFAPTFTVIKLARANELLPIATCGTSLRRMSLPFIVASFLAAAAIAALDEYVLPNVAGEITESDGAFGGRGFRFNVEDYDGRVKLWAFRYDYEPQRLLSGGVRITRLDDTKQPVEIITAKRAQWDVQKKRWVAYEGSIEKPQILRKVEGGKPRTWEEPIPPEGFVVECSLTPEGLQKESSSIEKFSSAPLRELIETMRRYPHVPGAALRVHSRFSFPLSPIVLLLVGLPFVMDPQSKSFIKGLIFCFLLALGFYVTHFACMDFGNKGKIPPIAAAWFPVASFGVAGLLAFARMKT